MSTALTLFLGLVVLGAASLVLWAVSLRQLARRASPFPRAAIVPVLTPIHAWRHGERMLAAALASAMLGYTTLWISAAVGGAA